MYLLQKSVHLWDDICKTECCASATVQTDSYAGLTAPTENIFPSSMFRDRKVNSQETPDSCIDAVLPLLAWFIPHAQCNVNESLYPDCTTLSFGKSWIHRFELLRRQLAVCGDRRPTVIRQTWTQSERCSVSSRDVSTRVGWYMKERVLRTCNRPHR